MNKEFLSWVLNQSPAVAVLIAISMFFVKHNERLIQENKELNTQIIEIYRTQNQAIIDSLKELTTTIENQGKLKKRN